MVVTIQETIEHSRDLTAEMIQAYLERHGWKLCYEGPWTRSCHQMVRGLAHASRFRNHGPQSSTTTFLTP